MKYLQELKYLRKVQTKRFDEIRECEFRVLKVNKLPSGKRFYSARGKGDKKFRYLGDENNIIVKTIKEQRYLERSLSRIDININSLEQALSKISRTDYDSVNKSLPGIYRDPDVNSLVWRDPAAIKWKEAAENRKSRYGIYKPEELDVETDDGNFVRSKSEGMIYNELLSKGITFVYELPLEIEGKVVFPDFTLLSEIDYKTEIRIEHQGMMMDDYYRNRFFEKVFLYWRNGYIQGVNMFYTFDTAKGGFNKFPIKDIIRTRIRPTSV